MAEQSNSTTEGRERPSDQTDDEPEHNDEGEESRTYDLALYQRDRCRGFAVLLDAAFEHQTYFDGNERRGIAQIAKDIADYAEECFQLIRAENIAGILDDLPEDCKARVAAIIGKREVQS